MAKAKQLKIGMILSYIQIVLSVLIGIVYTPTMIRLLGKNEYGLYNTVASTVSMLSILNLGFNSGYIRYFSKYKVQGEIEKIYILNGLFLVIFTVIGLIALLCGAFLTTNITLVFKKGLTAKEYETAKVLMLLLTLNLTVSFPMTVFSTIISANEHFIFLKLMGIVRTVIGPLVNLPVLLMGYGSIGLVTVSIVFGLITDIVYIYYVIVKLKNKFKFGKTDDRLFLNLFSFTIFIAINLVVNEINNGVDKVLLGRYVGTESVAVYAIGSALYGYYVTISISVSGVFSPRIHRIYNTNTDAIKRNKSLTELLIRVGRIQFLILTLIASGLVIFGKDFIRFWVGQGYDESYYVGLLLVLPATVPLIQNVGIEIQRAANKHQFRSIIYLAMAIINLVMTIYLCQLYGAVGAAIGTAISVIIANGFLMNWYYFFKLGLNIPLFWKNIGRMIMGMLPTFAIGALIKLFFPCTTIWHLIVYIVIYTCIYFSSVWLLSMNDYEKELIRAPIRRALKK